MKPRNAAKSLQKLTKLEKNIIFQYLLLRKYIYLYLFIYIVAVVVAR